MVVLSEPSPESFQ